MSSIEIDLWHELYTMEAAEIGSDQSHVTSTADGVRTLMRRKCDGKNG